MKKITILSILLYAILSVSAQQRVLDSLQTLLSKAKNDTVKVSLLVQLSDFSNNTDSIFLFSKQGLRLADSLGFEKGVINNKINLAFASWMSGDYPTAINLGYSLLESPIVKSSPRLISVVHAAMTNSYRDQGDFREALNLASPDTLIRKSGILFATIGSFYYGLGKYDSALTFLKKSLATKERFGYGWILLMIGRVHEKTNNVDSAFHYYYIGKENLKKRNNFKDLSGAYTSLGELYFKIGKIDSAIYFGKQALQIAQIKEFQKEVIDSYLLLAKGYEKLNSPDALKYFKLAIEAKDKIYSQERQRQITGFKFSEQLKIKDQEREKSTYESKIRTNTLLGSLFTLMVIAVFLYRSSRQKQKAKQKIEQAYDQLKATQSQLIQSEKMASLGELTAGIAHEIQNPLNFVNNFSEVNKELLTEMNEEIQKGNFEEVKTLAKDVIDNQEKINHHGKRADAIVKSMLQHSRKSSNQKERTDINALCDEYLRLSYHGLRAKDKSFNAKFETDFDLTLPSLSVIQQDIGRVLLNLVNNAFYAVSEKSSQAKVLKDKSYEPTVLVSTKKSGNEIQIRVSDNGTGVPQHVLEKIFHPFFTTKPTGQGTGLGLSLSYDIMKAHNGNLKVETKVDEGNPDNFGKGGGTTFICSLPING